MAKFTIKTESLPTRCEICHQSDRFDPVSGVCVRCVGAILSVPEERLLAALSPSASPFTSALIASAALGLEFLILGFGGFGAAFLALRETLRANPASVASGLGLMLGLWLPLAGLWTAAAYLLCSRLRIPLGDLSYRATAFGRRFFRLPRRAAILAAWTVTSGTIGFFYFAVGTDDLAHQAVAWRNGHSLRFLRAVGADFNRSTDVTPLERAAGLRDTRLVELLLDLGADGNRTGHRRLTPLMRAAVVGSPDTVRVLLAHGADANSTDAVGDTALIHAARTDAAAVAHLLDRGAAIDHRNRHGRSALMEAVDSGNLDAVQLLLDRGANPTLRDGDARTALDLATSRLNINLDDPYRYARIATVLIKNGARTDTAALTSRQKESN